MEPIRLAVEAIPEEEPSALPSFDDPTIDMEELEQDDFFSGEHDGATLNDAMSSGGGDYDDELEWMQTKRKSMVTWWLLFFGALGGVGYFALDFLNQQDSNKDKAVVEEPQTPPETAEQPAPPPETDDVEAATAASTEADEEAPVTAGEEEPPVEEAVVANEPPSENDAEVAEPAPEPPPPPVSAPAARASAPVPAAPARISPSREIDRGWAKIDRENWSAARTHFANALEVSPGNGDAQFGLAYVNENEGRVEEAVRQYCRLQATGSGEAKVEASGRLRALGRTCP